MEAMYWQPATDFQGNWSGKLWIQADHESTTEKIFNKVHGLGVEVNGSCYVLEAANLMQTQDASKTENFIEPTSAASSATTVQIVGTQP